MNSIPSGASIFEPPRLDASPWRWGGALLIVMAVGLMAFIVRLPGGEAAVVLELRTTDDPAEILRREAAISAVAPNATQGDVFTPELSGTVRAAITTDMALRSVGDRASLMNDVPADAPRVNDAYPTAAALATFPPLLLQALPALPGDLEYRFMGDALIVRDGRTNRIVDVLPGVMPAVAGGRR